MTFSARLLVVSFANLSAASPAALPLSAAGLRGFATGPGDYRRKFAEAEERRLQASACNIQPLVLMAPPSFQEWHECIDNGITDLNRTIAGAEVGLLGECWCSSNALESVQNHSCCEHPDFVGFCALDCQANCTSERAQQCVRECPALCWEADYAPDGCFTRCQELDCLPYLLCTTDHAANTAHMDPSQTVCHEENFHSAPEMLAYLNCLSDQPMRTNWQRWNSQHFCFCESQLKAAAERENCCGADWADPICNLDCQLDEDCNTVAGTDCATQCTEQCDMIHPHLVRQSCNDNCFEGTCNEYRTCEPPEQESFEYLCDDGSSPQTNGCCNGLLPNGNEGTTCPALCRSGRKYILPHGEECQCFDCPTTAQQAEESLNATFLGERHGGVSDTVWQNGQTVLSDIAWRAGLIHGPTPQMQAMMVARNVEIGQAISRYGSGAVRTEREIVGISNTWNEKIEECAVGGPEHESCDFRGAQQYLPEYAQAPETIREESDEGGGMLIIVIIVCAVVVLGLAGTVFVLLTKKKGGAGGPGGNARPIEGDPNVVVGRPVEGGAAPPQFDAAGGAPVATDAAKGDGEK